MNIIDLTFKAELGEMLEVLPGGLQLTGKSKHYVVRLRHDLGTCQVITQAPDHKVAITNVIEAAGAPRQAVISVQRIKAKKRTATIGSNLKALKYANVPPS